MPRITISYRREDSGIIAGRIFDRLVTHYGANTVFRDIDNIPPGLDFRKYINDALETTDILLAIVGPQWAGRTSDGRQRIQEIADFVRVEVETALRKGIPVIPILVANAIMPQPSELPETLQDFAFRNAVKVDGLEDFDSHVARLIRSMDRLVVSQRPAQSDGALEPSAPPTTISAQGEASRAGAPRSHAAPGSSASPADDVRPGNASEADPNRKRTWISALVRRVRKSTSLSGRDSAVPISSGWSRTRQAALALVVLMLAAAIGVLGFLALKPQAAYETASVPDTIYNSPELGVTVVYPQNRLYLDVREEKNLKLSLTDGFKNAQILISRTSLPENRDLKVARQRELDELTRFGYDIKYPAPKYDKDWSNWYVLSGVKEDQILYVRRWYLDDSVVSIEFRYPHTQAVMFNRIIDTMTHELHPSSRTPHPDH